MTPTVLAAIISGAVTLCVCLINNHYQQNKLEAQYKCQHDETMKLLEYKLDELSKRVDKHNNIVERTYKLEQAVSVYEEKMKVANHRIDDLEEQ